MKINGIKRGAPSKLMPEVLERLLRAIELGATYESAAAYAGISYSTLNNWMNKAKTQKHGEFLEFLEALKRAKGQGVVACLEKIQKAASEGSWQAAAWILERRYPESYGRKAQEIEPEEKEPFTFTLKIPNANKLAQEAEQET